MRRCSGLLLVVLCALQLTALGCAPQPADCGGSCSAQQQCVEGACRAVCNGSNECGSGESCYHGTCLPLGKPCLEHKECLQLERCVAGSCKMYCVEPGDCLQGLTCVSNACVVAGDGGQADAALTVADAARADGIAADHAGRDAAVLDSTGLDAASLDVTAADGWSHDSASADGALRDGAASDGTQAEVHADSAVSDTAGSLDRLTPDLDAAAADACIADVTTMDTAWREAGPVHDDGSHGADLGTAHDGSDVWRDTGAWWHDGGFSWPDSGDNPIDTGYFWSDGGSTWDGPAACEPACAPGSACIQGSCSQGECGLSCSVESICCGASTADAGHDGGIISAAMALGPSEGTQACVWPLWDTDHCGGCGVTCRVGQYCERGRCLGGIVSPDAGGASSDGPPMY